MPVWLQLFSPGLKNSCTVGKSHVSRPRKGLGVVLKCAVKGTCCDTILDCRGRNDCILVLEQGSTHRVPWTWAHDWLDQVWWHCEKTAGASDPFPPRAVHTGVAKSRKAPSCSASPMSCPTHPTALTLPPCDSKAESISKFWYLVDMLGSRQQFASGDSCSQDFFAEGMRKLVARLRGQNGVLCREVTTLSEVKAFLLLIFFKSKV